VLDYVAIAASIFTDAPSTFQGVVAEFSTDGANVVSQLKTTIQANFGAFFEFAPQARYFRIRYQNGSQAQTVLRNQILFKFNPSPTTQAPIAGVSTDASVAGSSRAFLTARNEDNSGLWTNLSAKGNGALNVNIKSDDTKDTLCARMVSKTPAIGYTLWFDTADLGHIYTLEAPLNTAAGVTGFRGIRVTINSAGYPVGKVQVNSGGTLTWDNRTTDGGWT
jgi:hypothetical protein